MSAPTGTTLKAPLTQAARLKARLDPGAAALPASSLDRARAILANHVNVVHKGDAKWASRVAARIGHGSSFVRHTLINLTLVGVSAAGAQYAVDAMKTSREAGTQAAASRFDVATQHLKEVGLQGFVMNVDDDGTVQLRAVPKPGQPAVHARCDVTLHQPLSDAPRVLDRLRDETSLGAAQLALLVDAKNIQVCSRVLGTYAGSTADPLQTAALQLAQNGYITEGQRAEVLAVAQGERDDTAGEWPRQR